MKFVRFLVAGAFALTGVAFLVPAEAQRRAPGKPLPRQPAPSPPVKPKPKLPSCPSGYKIGPRSLKGGDLASENKVPANRLNSYAGKCVEYAPARCCNRYESGGKALSCSSAVIAIQPGTTHAALYKPPGTPNYNGPVDHTWYCACREGSVKVWGITDSTLKLEAFSCLPKGSKFELNDMPGNKTARFWNSHGG